MKKGYGSAGWDPKTEKQIDRYQMIDMLKHKYPVSRICKVFGVNRLSYYKWVRNGKPKANNFSTSMAQIIHAEHHACKKTFGVIRLKHQILRKYKINMNHKMIRRYLRLQNLETVVRKSNTRLRVKIKIAQESAAPNMLNCNFEAAGPLQKLSTDVTYIKYKSGVFYLSVIKDLYNKQIISFKISSKNDNNLVLKTILQIKNGSGIIHSDQGHQYTSHAYRVLLAKKGYLRSNSRKGCCWENSPVENWFSQLKEECLRQFDLMNFKDASTKIKEYIHWYNSERIQKGLGYLTPVEYSNSKVFFI